MQSIIPRVLIISLFILTGLAHAKDIHIVTGNTVSTVELEMRFSENEVQQSLWEILTTTYKTYPMSMEFISPRLTAQSSFGEKETEEEFNLWFYSLGSTSCHYDLKGLSGYVMQDGVHRMTLNNRNIANPGCSSPLGLTGARYLVKNHVEHSPEELMKLYANQIGIKAKAPLTSHNTTQLERQMTSSRIIVKGFEIGAVSTLRTITFNADKFTVNCDPVGPSYIPESRVFQLSQGIKGLDVANTLRCRMVYEIDLSSPAENLSQRIE